MLGGTATTTTTRGRMAVALAGCALAMAGPMAFAPRASAATIDNATLHLSSLSLSPGVPVTATVTADLPANRPANNVQAHFSSSGDAHISPTGCSTNTSGQCSVTLTAAGGYGGQTISVDVTGIGFSAAASAPITEFDAPSALTLAVSPGSLQADGISESTATATLQDAAGRGVGGEPVAISSSDAAMPVGAVTDHGDGTYTATLTAPPPNTAATGPFTDTITAALSSFSLSAQAPLALSNPAPRLAGPLSVSGSQVLDANRNPVALHGIDAGYFYASATNPQLLTNQAIGNMYLWGANYVRMMMSSDLYLQPCSGVAYPPGYADAFDRQVQQITSYGMLAVIDLHLVNPTCRQPASNGQYGSPLPLPDATGAQQLFSRLTAAFAGNPLVAYELYNEPYVCADSPTGSNDTSSYPNGCSSQAVADQAWVNGGTVTLSDGSTYAGAGMKSIYDTVRTGAPGSLVFVDANGFASDRGSFDAVCQTGGGATCLWENPTGLVYVFHYYNCQDATPAGQTDQLANCENGTPETCATISGAIGQRLQDPGNGNAAWPAPVDFDEFGWPQNEAKYQYKSTTILGVSTDTTFTAYGHGLWINNVIATLESHGAGWSVFAYGNAFPGVPVWQGPYTLVADADSVPWPGNPDGQATIDGLQGQAMTCTDPPAGDG